MFTVACWTPLKEVTWDWLPQRDIWTGTGATAARLPRPCSRVGGSTIAGCGAFSAGWYHFDLTGPGKPTARPSKVITRRAEVLPVHLRFRGMPAPRFWAFEQGDVSFGAIDVGPENLARVAVAGYATVYGGDWYVVPLQVRAATLTSITSLRVRDDFGGRTVVPAAAVVDGG